MSSGWKDAWLYCTAENARTLKEVLELQAVIFAQMDSNNGDDEYDLSDLLDDPTVPGTPFEKYKSFYKDWRDQQERNEPKCDCGSDKTYGKGSNLHTDWCSVKKR